MGKSHIHIILPYNLYRLTKTTSDIATVRPQKCLFNSRKYVIHEFVNRYYTIRYRLKPTSLSRMNDFETSLKSFLLNQHITGIVSMSLCNFVHGSFLIIFNRKTLTYPPQQGHNCASGPDILVLNCSKRVFNLDLSCLYHTSRPKRAMQWRHTFVCSPFLALLGMTISQV